MCEVRYVESKHMFPVINEILSNQGKARITVTGMSMYPFLREFTDSVELSSSNFCSIVRGDVVIILRDSGEYVMHRVVKKQKDYFYMVGDAQQWIEGPLLPDQLIAIVTSVWRNDKLISCSSFWWKLLSHTWLLLLPFRRYIIRAHSLVRRAFYCK